MDCRVKEKTNGESVKSIMISYACKVGKSTIWITLYLYYYVIVKNRFVKMITESLFIRKVYIAFAIDHIGIDGKNLY